MITPNNVRPMAVAASHKSQRSSSTVRNRFLREGFAIIIGSGEGKTRGQGEGETRRRRIQISLSPHSPYSPSPCPLVPLSPCLLLPTPQSQLPHRLLKNSAPMFVIVEHVEAGAGRGEQHYFAGFPDLQSDFDRLLHRRSSAHLARVPQSRRDLVRRRPDQNHVGA